MAKARVSTNPMYTGGAGGYSFYVRGGEQVVRQRKNNSNYGESASRSQAQMDRRVRWANLVNLYKLMAAWQPKAYESKKSGQTDYNIFMSLNINNSPVGLTKDMALQGCVVIYAYTISRGSLPPISMQYDTNSSQMITSLRLSQAITSATTVGQFASDVIDNNPEFRANDNIAFILFRNSQTVNNYPYATSEYKEVTLDIESESVLESVVGSGRFVVGSDGFLHVAVGAAGSQEAGMTLIHTRKVNGNLLVSSQKIQMTGEYIWGDYAYPAWIQQCIESYGLDNDVPLSPGAGGGGGLFTPTLFWRSATYESTPVQVIVDQLGRIVEFPTGTSGYPTTIAIVDDGEEVSFTPITVTNIPEAAQYGSVEADSQSQSGNVRTVVMDGQSYAFDMASSTVTPSITNF